MILLTGINIGAKNESRSVSYNSCTYFAFLRKEKESKKYFFYRWKFFFFHKKTTEKTWFSLRELQNTLCISVAFMDGIIFSLEDFKNLRKRFKWNWDCYKQEELQSWTIYMKMKVWTKTRKRLICHDFEELQSLPFHQFTDKPKTFFFTATPAGMQYILQFVESCAPRCFWNLLFVTILKCCSTFFRQRSAKCCYFSFIPTCTWSNIISRWLGIFKIHRKF